MTTDAPNLARAAPFTITDLDYELPPERIAQQPLPERDAAKLLVLERSTGRLRDLTIHDLPDLLRPDDLLVLNNTRVLPAKFHARRRTGGVVPGLFLAEESPGVWRVMLEGSKRLKLNEPLVLADGPMCQIELLLDQRLEEGTWRVRVGGTYADRSAAACDVAELLEIVGETPLPPYIHRSAATSKSLSQQGVEPASCQCNHGQEARATPVIGIGSRSDDADRDRYQTVFAQRAGAIAAPTAGLHFSHALLEKLRSRGIETAFVTLHVGVGTFKPIVAESLSDHRMHAERYELPATTASAIAACRGRAGRVIAVGTTSVRVLETCADFLNKPTVDDRSGQTDIFLFPPYSFRAADALLTNFHLPRSTLLALVMAFAGPERIRAAYAHAIEHRYRFYSYGDAMLIL